MQKKNTALGALRELHENHTSPIANIISLVWREQRITRSYLAQYLGVNKSTISRIVDRLLSMKILEEGNSSAEARGRPKLSLQLNAELGVVIGIELRPEGAITVLLNAQGQRVQSTIQNYNQAELTQPFLTKLSNALKAAVTLSDELGLPVLGAGIGLPGIIDPYTQRVIFSLPHGIRANIDLHPVFTKLNLGFPIAIENDANCCCWLDLSNPQSNHNNFLSVLGELHPIDHSKPGLSPINVGMGFVFRGQIHYGKNYTAGEFQSILKSQPNMSQFNLSPQELPTVLNNTTVFNKFLGELATNIGFLADILNLDAINIHGNIVNHQVPLKSMLEVQIKRNWPHSSTIAIPISFSSLGQLNVASGAGKCILARLLAPALFRPELEKIHLSR